MNAPTNSRKALLFIGSPKGLKSASYGLGGYLLRKLEAAGLTTETMVVGAALRSTIRWASQPRPSARRGSWPPR